jgi:SAM-dependent methyltransferase
MVLACGKDVLILMKWFYELIYDRFQVPWDVGPRVELVNLVESGRIRPCKAIDLGSGTASNCVFLAQRGFEVTGADFAAAAIELGRKRAEDAGVQVDFIQDDLTNLQHVNGSYDLLVDYSTMDDLKPPQRDLYLKNVLPLTHPGSKFVFYCHEWPPRWWERPFFSNMACEPGEVHRRFSPYFEIEKIVGEVTYKGFPAGYAVYLMIRNEN